jgi:hypothetical protein
MRSPKVKAMPCMGFGSDSSDVASQRIAITVVLHFDRTMDQGICLSIYLSIYLHPKKNSVPPTNHSVTHNKMYRIDRLGNTSPKIGQRSTFGTFQTTNPSKESIVP